MDDGQLLDTVLRSFTDAITGSWGPNLNTTLLPLLLLLVTLQFGLIAIEAAIARDIPLLLIHVLLGIIRVAIVVAIFDNAFEWATDIVQTGADIGTNISGISPTSLTPSGVFNTGLSVAQTIFAAKASGGWLSDAVQAVEFLLVGTAVGAAWLVASLLYLGALLESILLIYGGPLVIAFTPLSWTFDMLIYWGKALLQIAFKVALILMTLGVGMALANKWVAAASTAGPTLTTNAWNLLVAVVEAVLFAWCVWKVPSKLSGISGGGAILGFTEAVVAKGGQMASGGVAGTFSSGGAGSQSSAGAMVSSQGWAAQAGKALAQKVQTALTK